MLKPTFLQEYIELKPMSYDEQLIVARKIRHDLIKKLQKQFKYIESLKDAKVEYNSMCGQWTASIEIMGNGIDEPFYILALSDITPPKYPVIFSDDYTAISKIIRKMDDIFYVDIDNEENYQKEVINISYENTLNEQGPVRCTCDMKVILSTGCRCGGI